MATATSLSNLRERLRPSLCLSPLLERRPSLYRHHDKHTHTQHKICLQQADKIQQRAAVHSILTDTVTGVLPDTVTLLLSGI